MNALWFWEEPPGVWIESVGHADWTYFPYRSSYASVVDMAFGH